MNTKNIVLGLFFPFLLLTIIKLVMSFMMLTTTRTLEQLLVISQQMAIMDILWLFSTVGLFAGIVVDTTAE